MTTILFIAPTGTFDNGAEISIFNFMNLLVRKNCRVINVAPIYSRENRESYKKIFEDSSVGVYVIPAEKWWWEDAPGGLPGTEYSRSFAYRDNIEQIRQIIKEEKVDLVITNTVNMFQGAVAAALESIPHFWLIHEFPEGEFGYYRDKLDFIKEYSDQIYSVAGLLNIELNRLSKPGDKLIKKFIPYTSIETQSLKVAEKCRFVSVGRLTERKNQLELLKAYKQLNQGNIELLLIGAYDEDYKKKCEQYIKENQLTNVKLTGHLENPWEILTDKDIFISSSGMETFGLVYVEALLNGIPTIISDNPGYESAYELFQIGQKYHLGEIKELANLMKSSLDNFETLKEESMARLDEVRNKYSLSSVYQEIMEDIENLESTKPKSIRHLAHLLENAQVGQAPLGFISRVKRKVKKIIKRK